MPKKQEGSYSIKVVEELYSQVPAFTDVFDDENEFYTFVLYFVTGTFVLVFIISRFVTLRPVEW